MGSDGLVDISPSVMEIETPAYPKRPRSPVELLDEEIETLRNFVVGQDTTSTRYELDHEKVKTILREHYNHENTSLAEVKKALRTLIEKKRTLLGPTPRKRRAEKEESREIRAKEEAAVDPQFLEQVEQLKKELQQATTKDALEPLLNRAEALAKEAELDSTKKACLHNLLHPDLLPARVRRVVRPELFHISKEFSKRNVERTLFLRKTEKLLGRGTFKEVYRIFLQTVWGKVKMRAIAYLNHPTAENRAALERECTISADLKKARVPYLLLTKLFTYKKGLKTEIGAVSEACSKGSLDELDPGIDRDTRMELLQQLAEAISGMHEQGYCHLDLKRQNVFLTENEGHLEVRLADFGAAKQIGERTWGCGSYNAPEQHQHDEDDVPVSEALDMWAFGNVIVETLYGTDFFKTLGFQADTPKEVYERRLPMIQQELEKILPPLETRNSLERILPELFSINPSDRPSAKEVLEAIQNS